MLHNTTACRDTAQGIQGSSFPSTKGNTTSVGETRVSGIADKYIGEVSESRLSLADYQKIVWGVEYAAGYDAAGKSWKAKTGA